MKISDAAVMTDEKCPRCGWYLYREPGGWFDDEFDPPILVCPQCDWDEERDVQP